MTDADDNLTPETLVSKHLEAVKGYCLAHARTINDAEDIVQTVMVKAIENLSTVKDRTRLRHWLIKIAARVCIDHYRNKKRHTAIQRHNDEPTHSIDDQQIRELHSAIQKLPEIYKEPICLYYLDQRQCSNVASALGIKETTVRQRLLRGRLLLYDLLEHPS